MNIEDTLSGKWDTLSFASPHSAALGLNVAPDTYDQYLRSKSLRRGGKRRGFILDPTTSNFRKFWDVMLAVLIVYNALAVPLRLGFDLPGDVFLFWFDLFTDSLFIFDIILNFRTAMESAGVLIDKPSEIAREYLRTWFVIDVVSAFPIDLVLLAWGISPGKNSSSYRVNKLLKILKTFRLIKVFRLARLARIMARFRAIFNVRYSTSTIFKFFIAVAFVAHWIACFWYFVAVLEGLDNITWVSEMRMPDADVEGTLRHEDLRTKYIVCIYHAIMVLSTIGSHILPVTNAERTYSLLTMFLGSSIYAYGITNGIYLIYNLNRAEVEYKQRMDAINDFMCTRHMPAELRNKVRQYYEHLHNKQRFFNEHEIIGELSRDLQTEVVLKLNESMIRKNDFFKSLSKKAVTEMIQRLDMYSFLPNENIVYEGEVGNEMFFLYDGLVEVYLASENKILTKLGPGDYFGEIALMSESIRTASVRALTFCDLYTIRKEDMDAILSLFPEDKEKWNKIASRRIRRSSDDASQYSYQSASTSGATARSKSRRYTYEYGYVPNASGSDQGDSRTSWKTFLKTSIRKTFSLGRESPRPKVALEEIREFGGEVENQNEAAPESVEKAPAGAPLDQEDIELKVSNEPSAEAEDQTPSKAENPAPEGEDAADGEERLRETLAGAEDLSIMKQLMDLLQNERDLRLRREMEVTALQAKMQRMVEGSAAKGRGRRPSILK